MRLKLEIKYFVANIFLLFSIFTFSIPTTALADGGVISIINNLFFQSPTLETSPLPESDLASLIAPGIVRIASKNTGTITIYNKYDLDWKNHKVIAIPLKKPVIIPVNEAGLGSGFIITPDGFIVTNAHVVSSREIVYATMQELAKNVIEDSYYYKLSEKEQVAADQDSLTAKGGDGLKKMGKDLLNAFLKDAKVEIETNVVVFDPTTKAGTLESLIDNGLPAKVIKSNDNFVEDQKDVAIIKIDQDDLPAIPIASQDSNDLESVGSRIHIFGFPASSDFSNGTSGFLTPTFSSGSISAFKDSGDGSFKMIQTDTKSSSGSSGSPFLNEKGEVIGIMTYITAGDTETVGDVFSFAIPLSEIMLFVSEANVTPLAGDLYTHFIRGFNFSSAMHCQSALDEYALAQSSNSHFPVKNFIDPYIKKCETLQSQNKSIDSEWDQLAINLKSIRAGLILTIGGIIVFAAIFVVFFFLIRRLRKDEAIIAHEESLINRGNLPANLTANIPH